MTEILKGIGFIPGTDGGDVARLDGSWYYNWWYTPQEDAGDTTFVPMIWSHRQVSDEVFDTIKRQSPPAVLTWNEPGLTSQAALPKLHTPEAVEEVMGYWARIYEAFHGTGIPLGSPGPAALFPDQLWGRKFLLHAKRRGMNPDFVALHYYCDRACDTAAGVAGYDRILTSWRRWLDDELKLPVPIWVTEYGCFGVDRAQNRAYMERTFDLMLGRGRYRELGVERYCWFANRTFHPVFENAALVGADGALTEIGEVYRAVPPRYRGP